MFVTFLNLMAWRFHQPNHSGEDADASPPAVARSNPDDHYLFKPNVITFLDPIVDCLSEHGFITFRNLITSTRCHYL